MTTVFPRRLYERMLAKLPKVEPSAGDVHIHVRIDPNAPPTPAMLELFKRHAPAIKTARR